MGVLHQSAPVLEPSRTWDRRTGSCCSQHPVERSSASGVGGAFVEKTLAVRLLYGEGDKVTRETEHLRCPVTPPRETLRETHVKRHI